MIELETIITGLRKWVDAELLSRITGLNKWLAGAGVNILLQNSAAIFNQLKDNPVIKSMEIVDSDNKIDIDKLYTAILAEAKKSAVTFSVPLIGVVTINSQDVEKIYQYIKGTL